MVKVWFNRPKMTSMSKSVHVLSSTVYFESRIAAAILKYLLISAESISRVSDLPHLFCSDARSLFFRDSRMVLIMKYPKGKAKIDRKKYARPRQKPRMDEAARTAITNKTKTEIFLLKDPLSFILVEILYPKIQINGCIISFGPSDTAEFLKSLLEDFGGRRLFGHER